MEGHAANVDSVYLIMAWVINIYGTFYTTISTPAQVYPFLPLILSLCRKLQSFNTIHNFS